MAAPHGTPRNPRATSSLRQAPSPRPAEPLYVLVVS
jgi:hypothetical protein